MADAIACNEAAVDRLVDRFADGSRAYSERMAKKTIHHMTPAQVRTFVEELVGDDLHALRVLSLANAVTGAVHAAALSIHAIGAALAAADGLTAKHAIKQVDRLLSNTGIVLEELLPHWAAYVIGKREAVRVAIDWTDFEKDDHVVIAAYVITDHGRATPLAWKTFSKSSLKSNQTAYEDEFISLLNRIIPPEVNVTLLADRGFASAERFEHLDFLGFTYIIRFRGVVKVTDSDGITKPANEWVPPNGRARRIDGGRITSKGAPVPTVICLKRKNMKESWCLATNLPMKTTEIVNLYGRRFTIEETFRDVKDQRFGMGLKATSIKKADRRDRLLFVAAMAHALLTLLGAAGEKIGFDRMLKANTAKKRTLSLYRQGLFWYQALPNMRDDRLGALMAAFSELLVAQPIFNKAFGAL